MKGHGVKPCPGRSANRAEDVSTGLAPAKGTRDRSIRAVQRSDVTATCDVPKTFHDEGACLGSDSAHAATIVASSSRRVHMVASSKQRSGLQATAQARDALPVSPLLARRSEPAGCVGRDL